MGSCTCHQFHSVLCPPCLPTLLSIKGSVCTCDLAGLCGLLGADALPDLLPGHFGRRVPPKIHQEATVQCNWGDFHPDRSLSSVTSHSCKLIRLSEMLKLGKPRSPPQKIPNSQSVAFHGLAPRRHLHNGARKHPLRLDILNTARPVARMLSLDHPSRPSNFETSSRVLNPSRTSGFESSSRLLDLAANTHVRPSAPQYRCCQRAHEEACSPRSWRVHGFVDRQCCIRTYIARCMLVHVRSNCFKPWKKIRERQCKQVLQSSSLQSCYVSTPPHTLFRFGLGDMHIKELWVPTLQSATRATRRISLRFPNPRPLAFPTSVGHPRVVMRKRSRPCPLPHIDSTSSTLLTCTEY